MLEHLSIVRESIENINLFDILKKSYDDFNLKTKLDRSRRVFLIGVGKVSYDMIEETKKIVSRNFDDIICITHKESLSTNYLTITSSHPNPSTKSENAANLLIKFLRSKQLNSNDSIVFLISGGTSAMLLSPVEKFTLNELNLINDSLLKSGENVSEMNLIRKTISNLHGGGILKYTQNANVYSFIMKDNVQGSIESVGSGLTYPYDVKLSKIEKIVANIDLPIYLKKKILSSYSIKKNQKISRNVSNNCVADTTLLSKSLKKWTEQCGYETKVITSSLQGEAKIVSKSLFKEYLNNIEHGSSKKKCLIAAGEVTVTVKGEGKGGRCQELTWCMANELKKINQSVTFIAFASDGQDYIKGVSGAWATNHSYSKIENYNLDWEKILRNNNTNYGLETISGLIKSKDTSLNLCDVYVLFYN